MPDAGEPKAVNPSIGAEQSGLNPSMTRENPGKNPAEVSVF